MIIVVSVDMTRTILPEYYEFSVRISGAHITNID